LRIDSRWRSRRRRAADPVSGAGQGRAGAQDAFMAKPPPFRPKSPRPPGPERRPSAPARPSPNTAPARPSSNTAPARPSRGAAPDAPARPPRAAEAPRPAAPRPEARDGGALWLHGLHAVAAALANPRRGAKRLLATEEAEAALAARLPKPWRINAERTDKSRFRTFLPEDAVHQGLALLAEPLPPAHLEEAIAQRPGPVLLLDQVTDPRNVGAILRSAAAFGCAAVVLQDRHAPPETAALARAASGALELVPVVREVNLSRAIVALQKAGFWVLGLAGEASRNLAEAVPRDRRVALVLGAEEGGLRRLQRETCDELVRLPIAPEMESLNVAAAAAVALYEVTR
jgi:23S rRNA (guanosine2251-2'-O)-methyltransferase